MTSMKRMEPRLDWFRNEMHFKLSRPKNLVKGDPRNVCSIDDLFKAIEREMVELRGAIAGGDARDVVSECCDVANFAMMLADLSQHLREKASGKDV